MNEEQAEYYARGFSAGIKWAKENMTITSTNSRGKNECNKR